MKRSLRPSICTLFLSVLSYGAATLIPLGGHSQVWNTTANNRQWTDALNWSPASVPDGVDASATLGNIITSNRNIIISAPVTVGSLDFSSTNRRYTLNGTGSLIFENSSGTATITTSGTGGGGEGYRINVPLTLNSSLELDAAAPIRIDGAITGTGGLAIDAAGLVQFRGSNANTYTGDTVIESGELRLRQSNNITAIAGDITIGDGAGLAGSANLRVQSRNQIADSSDVTIESDGRLIINNNRTEQIRSLNSSAATAEVDLLNGNSRIVVGSGAGNPDSSFAGQITGSGRLRKDGDGTLTLSGNNTYEGRTEVYGGTLSIDSDERLGTAPASTVQSGVLLQTGGTLQTTNDFELNANRGVRLQSGGGSIETTAGTTLTYGGRITGGSDLEKSGSGTLRLTGSGSNSYLGTTTISDGTIALAKDSGIQAIGRGDITIQSGGTLLLENSNQIRTDTDLTLSGGSFSTGAGFDEGLGALTLTSDSTISLGSAAHLLRFASANLASWTPGAQLTIFGWQGAAESPGTAGRIIFTNTPAFSPSQLNNISFSGYGVGALLVGNELVPVAVPEAHTVLTALALGTIVCWRERRRLRSLLGLAE